jgi:hypothetical protein
MRKPLVSEETVTEVLGRVFYSMFLKALCPTQSSPALL